MYKFIQARLNKIFNFVKAHKIALVVGLVILVIAFIFLLPKIKASLAGPQAQYETTKTKKQDLTQTVSASGEIEAEKQVSLKFQTSGLLTWVGVKEGDPVKRGQAVASLDKRELEKDLKKKLLAYMNERWDFEQAQDDYTIQGRKIEIVPNLTDAEKRILEQAQFDLDTTVLDVEIKDLAKKLATITTPIDGIVTNIDSPVAGVNITPATATFTIANPSGMKFAANVDESDIGQVRLGQKVTIALDAYLEEEFEGTIGKIAFAAITASGGGTAFPVDILLPENIDQRFKVGMNGDVEIIIAQEEDVLAIPAEALMEKKGQNYVRVIEGKKIKEVEVETGIETDTKTQIIQGLTEGDLIITGEKKK